MGKDAQRIRKVMSLLKRRYGVGRPPFLHFSTPWQALAATILSAQAQDPTVNKATSVLFRKYPSVGDYARMKPEQLYAYTRTIGLYRGKSKNIINSAKIIVKQFDSKVPKTMDELVGLPGVGRKTANIVLSNAYNINQGIAIDTHCIRVSNKLGFVDTKDPVKIEKRLMDIAPKSDWREVNHLFIDLGRDVCTARKTYCERCVLNKICPSSTVRR
ncbi:MAG: endonuclease III [Candidatus Micrarchaeota archaeon]|nr:endonuclease III [Candidatus Micrarchaeota archaeon]